MLLLPHVRDLVKNFVEFRVSTRGVLEKMLDWLSLQHVLERPSRFYCLAKIREGLKESFRPQYLVNSRRRAIVDGNRRGRERDVDCTTAPGRLTTDSEARATPQSAERHGGSGATAQFGRTVSR